jgi:hypothetical protein
MKKTSTPKKAAATTEAKPEVKKAQAVKTDNEPKAKATKKETPKSVSIEKACEAALSKLKELNIDEGLQSEIQWCLGSYHHDNNPAGLYVMAKRALAVFTVELAGKTKGVTAKLITDLEKAIGNN